MFNKLNVIFFVGVLKAKKASLFKKQIDFSARMK